MIRDLRKADTPRVYEFLKTQFPEEEALVGTRPEGFEKVVRRIYRWDTQLVIRLARLFGRTLYRFFVVDADGTIVATTLLSFSARAGYVSMVVVDPAHRRRGHAKALLERARVTTEAAGKKYIVLDVLAQNTPALALYDKVGYRPLRESSYLVREPDPPTNGGASSAIRPFHDRDAPRLAEISRRSTPPEVQEVLPVQPTSVRSSGFVNRILQSQTAAWVIDRGRGPEAYLAAVATPATDAGHFSNPIIGEGVDDLDAAALVRTAVDWCVARGSPRIVAMVPKANVRGHAALEGGGFHDALALWTLYRTVA